MCESCSGDFAYGYTGTCNACGATNNPRFSGEVDDHYTKVIRRIKQETSHNEQVSSSKSIG